MAGYKAIAKTKLTYGVEECKMHFLAGIHTYTRKYSKLCSTSPHAGLSPVHTRVNSSHENG